MITTFLVVVWLLFVGAIVFDLIDTPKADLKEPLFWIAWALKPGLFLFILAAGTYRLIRG